MNLDLSKIVGISFDGASYMTGVKGVASRFRVFSGRNLYALLWSFVVTSRKGHS